MPSFSQIQKEIVDAKSAAQTATRKKYLKLLGEHTGHDVVLYTMANNQLMEEDDLRLFMNAFHGLTNDTLDLVIHSGGGRSEAAEQIVSYMRQKYRRVRAIIPLHAMSAATMLACSCDEIVMGKQSAIGPIDPQIRLGNVQMAAHAILEDVAAALADVRSNPATAAIWVPKLQQIPLGMLSQCKQSVARSKNLVREWLQTHAGFTEQQARDISEWLAEYEHGSHGRPIHAQSAREHGLNVTDLEADQDLQDLVLSLFHAATLAMQEPSSNGLVIVKMAENHLGTGMYAYSGPGGPFFPGMPQPGGPHLIPAGQQPGARRPAPGGQPGQANAPTIPGALQPQSPSTPPSP